MARNTITVDVTPEEVWSVLADPRLLANWVVGASRTRAIEGRWPEPGSVVHHTQLMLLSDTTSVVECDPGRRLLLEARVRPFAVAMVEVRIEPGTRIVLEEHISDGLASAVPRTLTDAAIHLRNRESVKRLKWLAEIGAAL